MSPQLIIAGVIAASSFLGGWTVQAWRYGAREADRAQQNLVDQRREATTAIRRTEAVISAQSEAEIRDATLRRNAASARTALVGLRASTDTALRAASASIETCLERATTISELLNTVADAGGKLAEKTDRHANDAKMIQDAWPK